MWWLSMIRIIANVGNEGLSALHIEHRTFVVSIWYIKIGYFTKLVSFLEVGIVVAIRSSGKYD